jgi:heme exporter protein A
VTDTPVVEATALTRTFGRRPVVDGVDLRLSQGECLALFGPNGAGKTTILRMIGGLLRPTAGTATVSGHRLPAGPEVRAITGLISHQTMLYDALSPRENVAFAARLYHVRRNLANRVDHSLQRMGILEYADVPVRQLSRGMRQRVSIARATVHDPSVVLADEPFTGLDASGAAALTRLLSDLRGAGAAILLVTHNLAEGLALASHAAIMQAGRFVRYESAAGLDHASYAASYVEMVSHD